MSHHIVSHAGGCQFHVKCFGHNVSVGSTNDFANVYYTIVTVLVTDMYENQDFLGCFSFARFMKALCQISHHANLA